MTGLDMRLDWIREDLEVERFQCAKLREQLTKANEEIGWLKAEVDDLRRKRAAR